MTDGKNALTGERKINWESVWVWRRAFKSTEMKWDRGRERAREKNSVRGEKIVCVWEREAREKNRKRVI